MTSKNGMTGAGLAKSAGQFIGIVALFALLGPPIGGFTVSAYLGYLAATPQISNSWVDAAGVYLTATLFGTVIGFSLAYIIGIVPAVGVGLAVAIWNMRKGRISWRFAIGAALVSWYLVAVRAEDIMDADEVTREWQICMLLAHLVAAGVCWRLARTIFSRSARPKVSGSATSQ